MDPAWFGSFVDRCNQRQSLPSVQEWIAAHEQLPGDAAAADASRGAGRTTAQLTARNDVRTVACTSGSGLDLGFSPQYNIFKDLSLHHHAAATIASAAQDISGFNPMMPEDEGVGLNSFRAYLNDFIAPHWVMRRYREHTVHHRQENHARFVEDLVSIVAEGVRAVGGGEDAARQTEEGVRSLAKRVASKATVEEKVTLFTTFWIDRPNSSDPVKYGIFYTTVHARHQRNRKTEVLSATTTTFSVVFELNSGVLIQHEQRYNALLRRNLDDWFNTHGI